MNMLASDPLLVNEVRVIETPAGAARIRLQVSEGGLLSLRAEPAKGERDEEVALALIRIAHEHAQARNLVRRVLLRRYRAVDGVFLGPDETFIDIVDALELPDTAASHQLVSELPGLLNARVH